MRFLRSLDEDLPCHRRLMSGASLSHVLGMHLALKGARLIMVWQADASNYLDAGAVSVRVRSD